MIPKCICDEKPKEYTLCYPRTQSETKRHYCDNIKCRMFGHIVNDDEYPTFFMNENEVKEAIV